MWFGVDQSPQQVVQSRMEVLCQSGYRFALILQIQVSCRCDTEGETSGNRFLVVQQSQFNPEQVTNKSESAHRLVEDGYHVIAETIGVGLQEASGVVDHIACEVSDSEQT